MVQGGERKIPGGRMPTSHAYSILADFKIQAQSLNLLCRYVVQK